MDSSTSPSTAAIARKSALAIGTHWLSAAAIVLAFCLVWTRELIDGEQLRSLLIGWHRQSGLLVLLLLAIRLVERWRWVAQDELDRLPGLLHWGAVAAHWLLYALLLAMPLLGWAMTSAQGHPVRLFGLLALPPLVGIDPDLADDLQDWHEWGAWCLMGLVSLHIVAALWHHLVRRDGVLASMLPLVRPRSGGRSRS